MQNKTTLHTHNEILPVSEPWHRGSGFTWMLLALAGLVFFLSGAVAKAQQNIYNRDNSGTGQWWNDGANPWYYSGWNSAERRPDIWPVGTRNNLFIGHNNNTTMTVNGYFFAVNSLTIQSGASSDRIFNSADGGGIGFASAGFTNSSSSASQLFNVGIGVDASTVNFTSSSSGLTTFASNFYLNANTAAFGGSGNFTLSGVVSGEGEGGNISKSGSGTLTLSGANTFSGTASVSEGTIQTTTDNVIANSASVSITGGNFVFGGNDTVESITATGGRLSVASGKTATLSANSSIGASSEMVGGTVAVASGATLTLNSDDADNTSALVVASGGTLKGSGTTTGTLSVSGILAPGNSTGILDVGNTTFLGGGNYDWEIDNFGGTVGTSWDFLNITGSLSISATSGDKFIIDVISLLASNDTSGAASGFVFTDSYSFAIATASGGISNFDAGKFAINTGGFQNAMTAAGYNAGSWAIAQDGNSLKLNYTGATLQNVSSASAIPEPSSASMLVLGLAALLAKRRREIARG
jgi:autotransporter-associated beta strand protein